MLKTDSAVFQAVLEGKKTFEIRKNDRQFNVGDCLVLRETVYTGSEMKARHNGGFPGFMIEGKPLEYTGRSLSVIVSHVLNGPFYDGLSREWCVLSIEQESQTNAIIGELKKEIQHWKANHDDKVENIKVLTQRPDLPFDRTEIYLRMCMDRGKLEAITAEAINCLSALIKAFPSTQVMLSDNLKAEIEYRENL